MHYKPEFFFQFDLQGAYDAHDASSSSAVKRAFKKNITYSNKKVALTKTRRILRLRSHRAPGADPRYIRQNIAFEVPAGLCRS